MAGDNNSDKGQRPNKEPSPFVPPYGQPPFPPPPPPPGYRGPFPPPPLGYRGPFPPPPYEVYEEIEEIEYVDDPGENSEHGNEVVEEEFYEEYEEVADDENGAVYGDDSQDEEFQHGRAIRTSDKSLAELQKQGFEKAVTIQKETDATLRSVLILKVIIVLLLLFVIAAGSIFVFIKFFGKTNVSTELVVSANDETAWNLPDDYANLIVRDFYRSIGGIAKTSKIKNKYFSGVIKIDGLGETNFYCIEKRGSVYVRTGFSEGGNIFFVDKKGKGVKLKTSSYVGPSEPIDSRMAETILNMMIYDELLSEVAYGRVASTGREPFRYTETIRLGDEAFETLKIKGKDSFEDVYCFDIASKRLLFRIIERSNLNMRVEYFGFKDFGNGVLYPSQRRVYIDNKIVASCVIDDMTTNRDVMFPR